mmetsp:Transcript_15979/g.55545  ORF Transcript_15979/g.55545 Transcript_15979/m.55545 type:complete len:440 (-) Transcript_15979:530-1849(-)
MDPRFSPRPSPPRPSPRPSLRDRLDGITSTDDASAHHIKQLMVSIGVSYSNPVEQFRQLVHGVREFALMKDIEISDYTSHLNVGNYFGLCVGGVCIFRVAKLMKVLLARGMSETKLKALVDVGDWANSQEIASVVDRLLHAIVSHGDQGLVGLSMVTVRPDALALLVDLVRANAAHPSRQHVLEAEGEILGPKGQLWAHSKSHEVGDFLEALDGVIAILIAEEEQLEEFLRDCILRRPPPLCPRGEVMISEKLLNPTWLNTEDLMSVAVKAVWDHLDHNGDDKFQAVEAREMLRLMLSRPLLSILVRSKISIYRSGKFTTEDQYMSARTPRGSVTTRNRRSLPAEVEDTIGLHAAFLGILDTAADAAIVSEELWHAMNLNCSDEVSGAEFREYFVPGFVEHVLKPVVYQVSRPGQQRHRQRRGGKSEAGHRTYEIGREA